MPEIPFAHQWSIPEDQLIPLKDSVNGSLRSKSVSNIPELKYYFNIYPNGGEEECRGQTWISFNLKFKNVKKVVADFILKIESANFSSTDQNVYGKPEGWGSYICKTEEFYDPEKKFIIDGKVTIKVYGIFKFESENDAIPAVIQEQKWSGGELGDKFWERNDTKDFSIFTDDGKEIKIHKLVFDVRSNVLTAMFNSNMKESTENKMTITDFTFNVIETGFKLIYDCNFTSSLSMEELISLLQFFDKYLLPELKAKVEPLLIDQISPSTVCRLTNASILTNSFKLKQKCIEFLSAAFISKTPLTDFDDLDKDIVISIIKNAFHGTLETHE